MTDDVAHVFDGTGMVFLEMLRGFGQNVFYGDASRVELLRAAGAETAKVLVVAVDDPERILEIIENAQKHFPNLEIVARATGRTHAYELLDAGIDRVFREHLDSSIRMAVETMRLVGVPAHEAHRHGLTFRQHDERAMRELRSVRKDRASYIRSVRLQSETLGQLLRNDDRDIHLERDAAWDCESMRKVPERET